MTYTPPNPSPPKHERFPSSLAVPLENSGYINWIPFLGRVGNYSEDILSEIVLLNDLRIGPTIRSLRC